MLGMLNNRPWLTVALVIAVAFSAGIGLSHLQLRQRAPAQVEGLLWPDPPVLDTFDVVDQHGARFTLEDLRGHWSLLFFGFTHCPDICPTTLDVLARAHEQLAPHPRYAGRGQVVFVSLDPERDTPAVLDAYVGHFNPAFIGVTAPVERLEQLTRALGVLFVKVPQPGGYTVDHSAGVFFVDPALRLVSVITPPHDVATVVERFDRISRFIESNP